MRTTTTTDAFLRALAHSKSVETQTLLLDEMLRSLISETESLDDDDDEDRAWFLDLRPREKYQKHSLSRSVNIPFDEISGSFHLLPPRETPFSVFVEEGRDDDEESLVSSFENQRETFQRGDFKGVQWNIKYAFVYNEHFINAVNAKMLKMQKDSSLGNGVDTHDVLALNNEKKKNKRRLWEPSPSVKELYREFLSNANVDNSVVLDLGSGVGRDSVYLASKGFDVLACDFDQKALTRTQEMAKLYSIEDKVNVLKWDARDSDAFARALSSIDDVSRLKLVLGVRFCHKPLFAQIVKNLPKESDCFFAWFHFAKGCEHSKVGRPNKEKDLIAPKEELRSIFTEDEGFEILKDDVSFLWDGRPSANFIARRKIENARA
jgi:SAM-dependent methyltransferase